MSPPTDYRRPLRPPQFSLRTMIGLVTLLAILFSLINLLHPLAMLGVVLLVMLVAAHIAGNAIGTRLREIGDQPVTREGKDIPSRPFDRHIDQKSFAPPTDLARKVSLGLPILIVSAAGILAGGISGGLWGYLSAGSGGWLNIVIGAIAFGFLGGFGSFAAFSFTQVLLGAWLQATREGASPKGAPANGENRPLYPL